MNPTILQRLFLTIRHNDWSRIGVNGTKLASTVAIGTAFSTTAFVSYACDEQTPFYYRFGSSNVVGLLTGVISGALLANPTAIVGLSASVVPVVIGKKLRQFQSN